MKQIIRFSTLVLITCTMKHAIAQLPDFYKKVDHLVWIVKDLKEVKSGWKKIGFKQIEDFDWVQFVEEGKNSVRIRAAVGYLGGARVLWLETGGSGGILDQFHQQHGDGVYGIVHAPGDWQAVIEEDERLASTGLGKSTMVRILTKNEELKYMFAKTKEEGKYVLGLTDRLSSERLFNPEMDGSNKYGLTFSQYAFAIKDPQPVSDFWVSVGFPEMEVTPSVVNDPEYYGKPADFKMDLGWQRHGNIVYEWCIPLKPPTVYADHISKYGEGFQHLGFRVQDMDEAIAIMNNKNLVVSQSGGWGNKGKKGSGRFAYVDTTPFGGVTIELLWSYKGE